MAYRVLALALLLVAFSSGEIHDATENLPNAGDSVELLSESTAAPEAHASPDGKGAEKVNEKGAATEEEAPGTTINEVNKEAAAATEEEAAATTTTNQVNEEAAATEEEAAATTTNNEVVMPGTPLGEVAETKAGTKEGYDAADATALCAGTLTHSCDSGFTAANIGADTSKHGVYSLASDSNLKVLRWMCSCNKADGTPCTSDSDCPDKCTRITPEGDLADVVRYYQFRSAHCGTTALTTAQSAVAIDAVQAEYSIAGNANVADIEGITGSSRRLGSTITVAKLKKRKLGEGDYLSSPLGDVTNDLELDLVGSDYSAGGSTWTSRAGSLEATVPAGVGWDAAEQAFSFSAGGSTITVDLTTNPNAMDQVSYEAWFKLPSSPSNKAWILSQSPDYGWSRAVTLNDNRLGYTGITPGTWDSGLGTPSVNEWHHVVGVWDQGGTSTIYLDGVKCADKASTSNGAGSNAAEIFNIGGRQSNDANHNPAVYISDVRVYSRAISDSDVAALFERGRRSAAGAGCADDDACLQAKPGWGSTYTCPPSCTDIWGAPTPPAPSCGNDLDKCVDFSMDDTQECVFASFKQLEQLISGAGQGSFLDYMRAQGSAIGMTTANDCFQRVNSMMSWSPATNTTLPDGRTGRKLLVSGAPGKESWIRDVGVKPSDAANVAFVTIQMAFATQDANGRTGKNIDGGILAQRATGAMQVKICKDGSVKGITSTRPFSKGWCRDHFTHESAHMPQTVCNGKDTYLNIDSLFRKAVALTRFELAKKFEASTIDACKTATWDGMKCMNSFFSDENAKCYLVDITQVPSDLDNRANALRVYSDGVGEPKKFSASGGEFSADEDGNGAYDCEDDQCTMKVCNNEFKLQRHSSEGGGRRRRSVTGDHTATIAWKKPSDGSTVTKALPTDGWCFKWDGDSCRL